MKFTYKQSFFEYRKAINYLNQRLLKKSKWRFLTKLSGFVFGLCCVIGILSLNEFYQQYQYADLSILWFALCTLLLGLIVRLVAVKVVCSKLCKNMLSPNGIYTSEIEAQISSENYLINQSGNIYQYEWKNFIEIEKTDEQIYLLLEPSMALYIPRASFQNENDYKDIFNKISKVYSEAQ